MCKNQGIFALVVGRNAQQNEQIKAAKSKKSKWFFGKANKSKPKQTKAKKADTDTDKDKDKDKDKDININIYIPPPLSSSGGKRTQKQGATHEKTF